MRFFSLSVRVAAMMIATQLSLTQLAAQAPLPEPTVAAPTLPTPVAVPVPASSAVENAVVKVFSTMRYPDNYKPWTKQAPSESTGTGVIIEGNRILTNAHVVLYASQVQVQANQSGDKIAATVEFISPGMDLAVLKVEDESLFDTRPALPRANTLPEIKDSVLVYGYPTGGTSLSITKGIVSRIEFTAYNFPATGLRIQIDAAINPGNSGGPAVDGEKMIGLAFSRLGGGDNIGYIIPNEEIDIFLKDIEDGTYDGKPSSHDSLQTFENPALRPFLKVDRSVEGMIFSRSDDENVEHYPLKQWDVITHIGDTPIDNQGMIKLGTNLRVHFAYLIQKLAKDNTVPLTIVRAGQSQKVDLPLVTKRPMLMPDLEGAYPEYFVYGPLVFSPATQQFIAGFNNVGAQIGFSARGSPLVLRRSDRPAFEGEELVVVASPFFPHKLSRGYSAPFTGVVKTVNGTTIKNLAHLVGFLRDTKDEFIVIDFYGRGYETLVFPRQELIDSTEDILSDNGVRAQGSPEVLKIWQAK
jgi:S1-C subfamily serine protease